MQNFVQEIYFAKVVLHVFKSNYLKFNIFIFMKFSGRGNYSIGIICSDYHVVFVDEIL